LQYTIQVDDGVVESSVEDLFDRVERTGKVDDGIIAAPLESE
jgi:hypothetical protein